MSEQPPNPFDLFLDRIREVVRQEIAVALTKSRPEKLLYTTREAADMLGVEESWLATKARAGLVPCRMLGHYRYFSMSDIDAIVASASVPVVYSTYDGQGVQADTQGAQDESVSAREGVGCDGYRSGEMGERRAADLGACGARDEALARKKSERGELNQWLSGKR
jgi:Helix-turn-helix domain